MHVIRRSAMLTAVIMLLGGCGGKKQAEELPPTCPVIGVLSDAAQIRVYREGGGVEQADVAYEMEFIRASLKKCKKSDGKLYSDIRFEIAARKGPAASSNKIKFPYFISVLGPDNKPVSKKLFEHQVGLKTNEPLTRFALEKEKVLITPPKGRDGAGYEILIGFQLTKQQLEHNRARQKTEPAPDILMQ